jgi:hypothetical protein
MIFRTALILLLLTAPLSAQGLLLPDKDQSLGFEIADKDLLQKYGVANDDCRGGNPNTLDMYLACAKRDVLGEVMIQRNYCYGKKGDIGAVQMYWHKCTSNSLKGD